MNLPPFQLNADGVIDTGPSRWGWSLYGAHARCPFYGVHSRLGLIDDSSEPRTRGSLGHVAMAHFHARLMGYTQVLDPEEAMRAWSYRNQQALPELGTMLETVRRYVARFPGAPGRRVLGVETEVAGMLGWLDARWGLWLLRDGLDEQGEARTAVHVSGAVIHPALVDCPGHPRHGRPVLASRKWDLVFEDTHGGSWAVDHKFKGSDVSERTAEAYCTSGEFGLSRLLAQQAFPTFAGLGLWLVQTREPWKIARPQVPATPARDANLPNDLLRLAQDVARCERDYREPGHWPRVSSEAVCAGNRYERHGCPARGVCMGGTG